MLFHGKAVERTKAIIALMWICVLPSWILFEYLFSATFNGLVVVVIPLVPYLFLFFIFLKKTETTKRDWVLTIFAGILTSLPELFLVFVFMCWAINGFAP